MGLHELWHLIYPRLLTEFGLLHKVKSYGISGQIFSLISSFLSNRQLWVVLDGKSSQEYPVNARVPQGFILGPTLFLLYINDLPDDVICDIAIYADDTTLYSRCDRASDLWQQLELASELESDLRHMVDWGKKWLVHFNVGKTQLVSFDQSNNNGSIDVKMGGSVLEEKLSFNMLGLTFSSKLDRGSYIISIAKTASKKIGALIRFMKFLSPEVALYLYKSSYHTPMYGILLSRLGWCPQLLLGFVRQATKTDMQDCWSFTCCFSWTLGSSSKCGQLKSFL